MPFKREDMCGKRALSPLGKGGNLSAYITPEESIYLKALKGLPDFKVGRMVGKAITDEFYRRFEEINAAGLSITAERNGIINSDRIGRG